MNFEVIKNKIGSLSYSSLMTYIIGTLKDSEKSTKPYPFWKLLTLLKWTLEFAGTQNRVNDANIGDMADLMEMIEQLEMSHSLFDFNRHNPRKVFAILAYQQFLYQESATIDSLTRQYIMFCQIKVDYDISDNFERLSGISIKNLLSFFSMIILLVLHDIHKGYKYQGELDNFLISQIGRLIGRKEVLKIIDFLLISKSSSKRIIDEDKRHVRNYELQPFDVSIFAQKPFVSMWNKILIPHRAILNQTCNYFIYDFLKNRDKSFSRELGLRMEIYMKMGLSELNVKYQTESELRKLLGKTHRVVDFFIDDCILVEAKAIELKPYASVNPNDELLLQELHDTIGKAYATQMLAVASKLKLEKELFGIIVTYKQLYLGNSGDMWVQFLEKETIKRLNNSLESIKLLPIENLFILDIDTWELLLQVLKENAISLADILREVRAVDANPKTKLFFFSMHLKKYGVKEFTHQYLTQAQNHIKPWL